MFPEANTRRSSLLGWRHCCFQYEGLLKSNRISIWLTLFPFNSVDISSNLEHLYFTSIKHGSKYIDAANGLSTSLGISCTMNKPVLTTTVFLSSRRNLQQHRQTKEVLVLLHIQVVQHKDNHLCNSSSNHSNSNSIKHIQVNPDKQV